ncbi:IclR family transcriptional regulator [Paraburkholderia susongensis]|uniref:Transcriptional regulator, IclR family n=1 Tax=Paraburkholderia susongensis TaxID=1515439 RepID=A0A1X7M5J4_9BURK|nr:IclR family transcriptional regulator C-terminal domain-containing protein [Paraburkholderia susongensis]SMG61024.1 transcriptional regulator, IclR family [Paraburkholderia susongensis]
MNDMAHNEESRLYINSLARGLQLLTAFTADRPAMKLGDLAVAAGMTKSAAQRFAFTLVALGYLHKNEATKVYSLAPSSLEIGLRYLQTNQLIKTANPYVHALNRACQETCIVAELDGHDVVYIARFPTHREMFVNMPIGMRLPVYCTATGRSILACLPDEAAFALLAACDRVAYTSETITDLGRLKSLLVEARERGFAWANGEYYNGDINISAAILAPNGKPIGAVNISAPSTRWTLATAIAELGPQVVETARAIASSNLAPAR